ncbi:Replication protein A DNA-binding subunit B [Glycine soja]
MKNTEIPMAERLTAVQNFGFLIKIPIAESLTPVQVFCFLVIYALLGWVGFLPPCCHVLFYGSMIMDFGVRLWFPVRDFRSSVVEGLCNFMARIPDKIRSIDGSKETLKLAVRITDLWFVGTPNKSEQAKMVFVDSEGDQIHAICKSDHLKSWKADLKENCTYVMHNFKVVKNDGQFRVCEHEYKLFFIGVTIVREADLHELPFKEFRFVEFTNVVASNFVSGLLVDIIGVVDQVVFRHVSSKNTRVVFRMKDLRVYIVENFIFHFAWCLCLSYPYEVMDVMLFLCCSGEILSCTLWEHYCAQFLSYLNERGDDGPMVVILTHARIKDAQGSYPASVSNSFKASKLLINDPILEIQEFKERLLDLGVEVSRVLLPGDQASSQVSGGSQLSSKDSFLSKAEAKTILEINAISEDVVCVTVGTISKIVMDNHSWCYPACAQCHRKTDIQTGPFTCGCGKDNDQPVLRYRVEVMVTQNNESGKFLLWDRECAELIGQTADGVNKVKIEDGNLDLNASPQALDKLLGHVLAFKVRIQSRFKNVVVLKYSKDLDMINVVLEMLPDSEACSKINPSNVDCNDATHAESDHDPVAGLPLTPKKRMSSDEANDELGSSQISPAQILSNKLIRHSHRS